MWPYRWQPTRLHHPWDSQGKNTGVGCHFLLQCMKVKSESEVTQSCPTLSDPMDCSLPGSSVHGIFQARVLEWGAIAFSNIEWYHDTILLLLFSCWVVSNFCDPPMDTTFPINYPFIFNSFLSILISYLNLNTSFLTVWNILGLMVTLLTVVYFLPFSVSFI